MGNEKVQLYATVKSKRLNCKWAVVVLAGVLRVTCCVKQARVPGSSPSELVSQRRRVGVDAGLSGGGGIDFEEGGAYFFRSV